LVGGFHIGLLAPRILQPLAIKSFKRLLGPTAQISDLNGPKRARMKLDKGIIAEANLSRPINIVSYSH